MRFACVVFNCKMRAYGMTPEQKELSLSEYLVSFHKFPSDLERRKLWTKALGNEDWVPGNDSVVCSLHFGSDCYDENNKLIDSAVPSIVFDNFEEHLKLILETIEKAKSGEIDFDHQINSNQEPKASKEDDTDGFSSSDSDFEIECEEILISDESDGNADVGESSISTEHETAVTESSTKVQQPSPSEHVPLKPVTCKTVTNPTVKTTNSSENTTSASSIKTSSVHSISQLSKSAAEHNAVVSKISKVPIEVTIDDDNPVSNSKNSTKETTISSKRDAPLNSGEPGIPKLHNIPVKEDTSEQARQLYSMIQSGSFQNFPVMQPASKNLVRQLLDIVKLANSRNQSSFGGEENIPNTYIITTKYDDPNSTAKVKVVETTKVISMVTQTVQAIKDGTYEKSDDLVIICGSPAIFLIKNVSVKTFDPNMNSVYVITSENLISYLYLLSTKAKPARKIATKSTEQIQISLPTSTDALKNLFSSAAAKNQKISFASHATKIIPQKLLASLSSNNSTSTESVASTRASSTSQEKSSLRPTAPTNNPENASSVAPVDSETLPVSSVGAYITRPVESLPPSAVPTKSVPLLSHPVAFEGSKSTPPVTSIASGPVTASSLLGTKSSSAASVVIPSKSSAFQAPKVAIAPLNAMRNNMASLKRKIDAIHKPSSPLPIKFVPSLVVTQSPATSNTITLPRSVGTTLNKTGLIKLTFAPALSSVSTPKTSQPLKLLQPTNKPQFVRLEPNKGTLKFDTVAQKRKTTDFLAVDPNPKRTIGIENAIAADDNNKFKSNVIGPTVPKPISPVQTASPEAPSPIGDDNVNSDSEEEKPLSPRAAQRLLATQRTQIRTLEQNIIKKERDILALRKKIPALKKRCLAAKKTADSKPDEQLVEDILKKYLDNDAVQFFVGQMKMSGKTFTQFRWTEEDKLFALGLLYRNPVEYNVLVQRFTLPSDKTLNKFVTRIKRAEMDANVTV